MAVTKQGVNEYQERKITNWHQARTHCDPRFFTVPRCAVISGTITLQSVHALFIILEVIL